MIGQPVTSLEARRQLKEANSSDPSENIQVVPITVFTVMGLKFIVKDYNAWSRFESGIFADGYWENPDPEKATIEESVLIPWSSIGHIKCHTEVLTEEDVEVDEPAA